MNHSSIGDFQVLNSWFRQSTRSCLLMFFWGMQTSMEICCPSTMVTITTKHSHMPVLHPRSSSRNGKLTSASLPSVHCSRRRDCCTLHISMPSHTCWLVCYRISCHISSIIEIDILPKTHQQLRLHEHRSNKLLGIYIWDRPEYVWPLRGVKKVLKIFFSCLAKEAWPRAPSYGLWMTRFWRSIALNMLGRCQDQVTDLKMAKSYNFNITMKPAN